MDKELTLREWYFLLMNACQLCEENPDNDDAVAAFCDAAFHLAKANCWHLFPEDLLACDVLSDNAAKTPADGMIITSVYEGPIEMEGDHDVIQ